MSTLTCNAARNTHVECLWRGSNGDRSVVLGVGVVSDDDVVAIANDAELLRLAGVGVTLGAHLCKRQTDQITDRQNRSEIDAPWETVFSILERGTRIMASTAMACTQIGEQPVWLLAVWLTRKRVAKRDFIMLTRFGTPFGERKVLA